MFTELIFKDYAFSDIESKLNSGEIKEDELKQYKFTIDPQTLNYIGTWHFDEEHVSFSNDKIKLDKKVNILFTKLVMENANIFIPH